MKTINRLLLLLITTISISFVQSCIDNDFETPLDGGYDHGLTANATIAQVKSLYTNGNVKIEQDLIIAGYVNSSDEEGNIFKTLYIQDDTGGIPIIIEKNGIYTSYRVGRKVYVKCKGLWIGAYGGMVQLGAAPDSEGSTSLSRLNSTILGNHIYKDKEIIELVPTTVSITGIDAQKAKLLGQLIKIDGVQFNPYQGLTYSSADATTDRTLVDASNNSIILRNSNYASFASQTVPNGSGSITAVLSVYNNKYQLYIRSTDDINFGPTRLDGSVPGTDPGTDPGSSEGDGSQANPYNIAAAIANQGAAGNTNYKWVKGYVVGVYETGSSPFTPNFTGPFTTTSNIIIAASADETNIANCLTVQLPVGDIRTALSPVTTPAIHKTEVKIQGALEAYFSAPGIKNVQAYEADGSGPGPDPGGSDGDGSQTNPYNIAAAITNQGSSTIGWIQGYIVGVTKSGVTSIASSADVIMSPPFTSSVATNVLLADNAGETDYTKCVVVNLPSGTNLRTQVNLLDNAGNYGKKLKVKGTLRTYFGIAGLRDVVDGNNDFELDGGSNPPSGSSIFEENFATSIGSFTTQNVIGTQVWEHDSSYGYMKMSGYDGSADVANEDWLISPTFSLAGKTSAKLTFMHAAKFGSDYPTNLTVWVSSDYSSGAPSTGTWVQVTVPNYPPGSDWTFMSSGDMALPAAVLGQANVKIAFKYTSSTTGSATWEIKDVKVTE